MAKFDRSIYPYFDDYKSENQFTHLLAIPGRVAQAREITQIQSTVKDIVKSLGDSILRDGNVIEGCQVIVSTDKTKVTVTPGKVYINGMVLPVEESEIAISGTGEELIGFELQETLITEDSPEYGQSLRDPAQGYDNFGQPGCHRVQSKVIIVKDKPEAAILSTLVDGAVLVENQAPEYDALTQTLARRTYDESGSYVVEGLKVRAEAILTGTKDDQGNPIESDEFNVVVESGKAYVLGYELKLPNPQRIKVDRSLSHISVGSTFTYLDNETNYSINTSGPYVAAINSVIGPKEITENLNAPTNNTASVRLSRIANISNYSSYIKIEGYTYGTDYTVVTDNQYSSDVKWLGTSKFPTSSFNITYVYDHTFEQGVDYKLVLNTESSLNEISWISTNTPMTGKPCSVRYELYLARKDVVYIDQYGVIGVEIGNPDAVGYETLPNIPFNTLALAYIMSPPGGGADLYAPSSIVVSNIGLTRFTMNDIQRLMNRLKTLEYDQAILSLNEEAKQYEMSGDKRGIFTDALVDISKVDISYDRTDDNGIKYDAAIDLRDNLCYLPVISVIHDSEYDEDINADNNRHEKTATLEKIGENVVLSQMSATKSFEINPYSQFPQLPEVSLDPSIDNWIEESDIKIKDVQGTNTTNIVSTTTRVLPDIINTSGAARQSETTTTSQYSVLNTKSEPVLSEPYVTEEELITYIRSKEIEIEGSLFPANLDNIRCYFDDTLLPMTATGSTLRGTVDGSVRSGNDGSFTAKITIPGSTFLSGIREVRLESDNIVDGYESKASALYQAQGILRMREQTRTINTVTNMLQTNVQQTTQYIDPVGQTFVLNRMAIIRSIDLYFEAKPTGTTPVDCEIREVVNGTITSTVLGRKSLSATEVNTSSDGKTATRFTFEDTVLLEPNREYAFVVRSTSPSYRIWVSELGGVDIDSKELVLSNPYMIGVMMSSSNNSSWTVHQTTDVKFRLIEDVYSESSEIVFKSIDNPLDFSRLLLLANTIVPSGTSLSWMYSLDGGSTYKNIVESTLVNTNTMNTSLLLKAVMHRNTTSNLSPIIKLDSVGVQLSSYDSEGYYVSQPINGLDEYSQVTIVLDTYEPTDRGSNPLEVYVSAWESNESNDIISATLESSTPKNYGWFESTYKATVPATSTSCRVLVKLSSKSGYSTPAFRRLRAIMS